MSCAIPDEFLWDLVGSQESAKAQESRCRWVELFDSLKRERPGCCHRIWIVGGLKPPSSEEFFTIRLIEMEVINEATSCLFDIRSCLVEGEWQEIQGNHNIACRVLLFI